MPNTAKKAVGADSEATLSCSNNNCPQKLSLDTVLR